ncbi:MAG: signal peptidase I, partial [Marmoricola sp.]
GTLVVVRHEPASQIRIGDVVTYQLHSGQPEVVTHRVVGISISLNGDYLFTTKGDANPSPDPVQVQPVQIRGVRWYSIPYLAWPTLFIGTDIRAVTVMGAVIALFAYAAWSFGGAFLDRRRRRARLGRITDEGDTSEEAQRTEVMQ